MDLRKGQAELVAESDEKWLIRVATYLENLTPQRLQELEEMPYQEFLHTNEWEQMSWLVQEVQKVCFYCGGKPTETHPHTYAYGRLYPEALRAICRNCHQRLHASF